MRKGNYPPRLVSLCISLFVVLSLNAQNLLNNPDAETGDIQGWVDPDNAWAAASEISPHGGAYFFWPARLDIPYTEMYQDVDMTSYVSLIDADAAWFNLSGWLANWDQYPHDRATLALEALNGNNEQLFYVSRDHRSPLWTQYQMEGQIPAGTRILRVHLIATRFVGSDNDGYFDDLSLLVNNSPPSVYVTLSAENGMTELPAQGSLQLYAQTKGSSDDGYTWSSSFNAVATVDTNGLVSAHQAGKFTIQATGKNSGKTGFIELTAYNPDDIIFLTPQTSAEWTAATIQEISWEVKGSISSGTLYYSLTGGSNWIEISAIDTLASGHYFWMVPDTNANLNNCFLKMSWNGGEAVSSKFSIVPATTVINNSRQRELPHTVQLYPNYPNPFNPSTTIRYRLPASVRVQLTIYDAVGRQVRTLVNGRQAAGTYEVKFDASDLDSGVYLFRLSTGNGYSESGKMILLR